jgi:RHS repeat-associated protein
VAGNKAGTAYPYILRQEYDKFLARRFQEMGNGVETENRYDSRSRRLNRIITHAPGRQVQDITYTYDLVGNVLTANNDAPDPKPNLMGGTSQQTFVYDDLYQLISANGTYNFAPRKHRDYTYDLAYDNIGNIVQKSQTDAIFNKPNKGIEQHKTTYDQLYDYNAAPHQPIHIGHQSYTYDAKGNLTGWTDDKSGKNRTVTWDAEDRVTSVADQGSTTRYTYDDEYRLAIERGPQGETSFVNRFYTVRNGSVAWKHFWAGTDRIATKREMPQDTFEHMLYFLHKDLLGSTNLITDPDGQVFEYVQYFPSGETWVLEHSNIHRTPYLYAGGYYDEFRELYNFGARWYEPREQLFYSPDPVLVGSPQAVLDEPTLLTAYSYAENNPIRLVDRDGLDSEDVQSDRQGSLSRPSGSLDQPKARVIKALVQQKADDKTPDDASRLDTQTPANSTESMKSKFEAFATFSAKPVVQINLTRTSDGLKLKNVKVAPFLFKQFTVIKGKSSQQ